MHPRCSWRNGKLLSRPDRRTAILRTATHPPTLTVRIPVPTVIRLLTLAHRMTLDTDVDDHLLQTVGAARATSVSRDHRLRRLGGEGIRLIRDHLRREGDTRVIPGHRPAGDKPRVRHRVITKGGTSGGLGE